MEIKILGSGCAKCNEMERLARQAVETLGCDATVEHVSDFGEIMAFGVMTTPALVIDGQVRLAGRVPSAADMVALIEGASASSGCGCGDGAPATGQGGCGCGSGGCC